MGNRLVLVVNSKYISLMDRVFNLHEVTYRGINRKEKLMAVQADNIKDEDLERIKRCLVLSHAHESDDESLLDNSRFTAWSANDFRHDIIKIVYLNSLEISDLNGFYKADKYSQYSLSEDIKYKEVRRQDVIYTEAVREVMIFVTVLFGLFILLILIFVLLGGF